MSSILVTGAAGVVGFALCEQLAATEHEIIGIDKKSPRWELDVPFKNLDLTSSPSLPNTDVIVHLAAHSRVPPVVDEPSKAFRNIGMTEPILEHARRTDARIVFTSSREVYGNAIRPSESDVGPDSVNPYGASKIAGEALCNSYHNCYDIPITVLRLANVYGPYDTNTRVVPIFIALATAGEELPVYGSDKILDFVYLGDVVQAVLSAIQRGSSLGGETINLGSGTGTSLTMLADCVADAIESCPGYRVESKRGGEVQRYVTDVSKARALLDWEPTITLDKGIDRTVDWYRQQESLLAEIRQAVTGSGNSE